MAADGHRKQLLKEGASVLASLLRELLLLSLAVGLMGTALGTRTAAAQASGLLGAPRVIANQIGADREACCRPQAGQPVPERPLPRSVPQGNVGEILPKTFRGCWQGTVDALDSDPSVPPFVMGGWMSETYRLCYEKRAAGPFQLTLSAVSMDPSPLRTRGIQIDDVRGRVEVLSTDGSEAAALKAHLHFKQKTPIFFGLLSVKSVADETVDLSCKVVNAQMMVDARFEETCNGALCFSGSWHQTFLRSEE